MVYVTFVPRCALAGPTVVTVRSADRAIGTLSVAVLLAGLKSGTTPGADTAAVFVSVPAAVFAGSVPVTVKSTMPPGSMLTAALIGPVPETGHDAVLTDAHTQVCPASGGTAPLSVTTAPVTALGPLFLTATRYRTGAPATAGDGVSKALVSSRSTTGTTVTAVASLAPD